MKKPPPKAKAKAKAKPKAKPKAKLAVKVKAKAKPKAKPAPKARPKPKAKPAVKAKPKAKPHSPSFFERRGLYRALELMAAHVGGPHTVEHVPATRYALWLARGTFYLPTGSTYDTVAEILEAWADDVRIARQVGDHIARIQVAWDQGRGKSGEYTLAEIGPWQFCLGRALERVTVRDGDRDSLVDRYGIDGKTSTIRRLYVWLGEELHELR